MAILDSLTYEAETVMVDKIDWMSDRIQPFVEFKMPDQYVAKANYRDEYFFLTPNQASQLEVTDGAYEFIEGGWVSFPLGIFVLSTPTREEVGTEVYRDVQAYDGAVVLKEDRVTERYTITAGTRYTDAMVQVLRSAGVKKYNIEQSDKRLPSDRDWPVGTEKIRIINDLAASLNYDPIHVDEYGYFTTAPYMSPSNRAVDYEYVDDALSVMYSGTQQTLDLFTVPNVFTIVLSNPQRQPLTSTVENTNPDSPTSVPSRGRRIVDFRKVDDVADQETLNAKVERIAHAASQVYGHLTFKTAIMPWHGLDDVLRIRNQTLGIDGKYAETGWRLPLEPGGEMEHEVRRVVDIQ